MYIADRSMIAYTRVHVYRYRHIYVYIYVSYSFSLCIYIYICICIDIYTPKRLVGGGWLGGAGVDSCEGEVGEWWQ